MEHRKLVAAALGTAVLVLIGVGVATLSSGFKLAVGSISAGDGRDRASVRGGTARARLRSRPAVGLPCATRR